MLRRTNKSEALKWAAPIIKQKIFAVTKDEEIIDMVSELEKRANHKGFTLDDCGMYEAMINYRTILRYGR
jgi:hypothetical protein